MSITASTLTTRQMMAIFQQLRPLRSAGPSGLLRRSGKLTVCPLCYNSHPRGKPTLTNLSGIVKQLSKERDRLHQQLSGLNAALEAFAGVYRGSNGSKPRRKLSAKGRASIAAAQRARWAKVKGNKVTAAKPVKRTMSASARRKIAAAQVARWAKVRREKKAA